MSGSRSATTAMILFNTSGTSSTDNPVAGGGRRGLAGSTAPDNNELARFNKITKKNYTPSVSMVSNVDDSLTLSLSLATLSSSLAHASPLGTLLPFHAPFSRSLFTLSSPISSSVSMAAHGSSLLRMATSSMA